MKKVLKSSMLYLIIPIIFSVLLFYINFTFTSNFYFNGDENFIIKSINQVMNLEIHKAFTGFYWKRAVPLYPIPFFVLMGTGFVAFRVSQSFFMALSLLFAFFFTRHFYKDRSQWVLIALLIVFPGISLFLINEYPFVVFLVSLCLLLFGLWSTRKDERFLYLLIFTLGFGIFIDLVMIYVSVSVLLGLLSMQLMENRRMPKLKLDMKHATYVMCFLIGISPMICINFSTGFYQWGKFYERAQTPDKYFPDSPEMENYNNYAVLENLSKVFWGFNNVITQNWKMPMNIPLFYLSVAVMFLLRRKEDIFLLMFTLSFLFLITFQPQWFKDIHVYFIIIPVILVFARGFTSLIEYKEYLPVRIFGYILLLIFLITNSASMVSSHTEWSSQAYIENQVLSRASFHIIAKEKYDRNSTYFPDIVMNWHISTKFPATTASDGSAYLCDRVLDPEKEEGGIYAAVVGYECFFEGKIDKESFYLFPTTAYMEGVMGDSYYERDVSVSADGIYYYYPFHSFRKFVEETDMTLMLHDEINNTINEPMFRIYRII